MDIDGLNRRAEARAEFNAVVSSLQSDLQGALTEVARRLGMQEVTIEALRVALPREGERLSRALAEVRSLSAALAELDALNKLLGQRALSYVRGYLTALNPTPSAYTRRGSLSALRMSTTVGRVV